MRVIILDPALNDFSGHHYGYNLALVEACRSRGIEVGVFANAACTQEIQQALGAVRCFEVGTYIQHAGDELDTTITTHFLKNTGFEQNLRTHVPDRFDEDDVILVHTATHDQIIGLLRWYRDLAQPRPRVAVQFMFPPWFRQHPRDRALATELQRRAMAAWAEDPGYRIGFFSDSSPLARHLEDLSGLPVRQLPMPITFPAEATDGRPRRPGEPLTFAYLGEPRFEKGFGALVRALVANRALAPVPMRFVIQASGSNDPGLIDVLRQALPNDVLVTEPVPNEAYWELLSAADAVLLPYDPVAYELRSSRILVEAVGLGKPVLVSAGCWLDKELAQLGGAGTRAEYTPPSMWDAIVRLANDYDALAEKARNAAAPCRRLNSPDTFLDVLLGPAPRRRDAPVPAATDA